MGFNGLQHSLGIHILNLGPYHNEIYNNYFNNLYSGITAVGENRNSTLEGLCLKCNDFVTCTNDIYITPELDPYLNPIITGNTGIAKNQGITNQQGGSDNTLAAGNTFSDNNGTNPNYVNDDGCNQIEYVHHGNFAPLFKVIPSPIMGDISINPDYYATYIKIESCPSNLGGGIDVQSEMNSLSIEGLSVAAYEDTLSINVDGGDTESLNFEVSTSLPPEAMSVRQELLSESPYLSDTVMKLAISKEDVLPNAMIRDVLVANPQSAKAVSVMQSLDQRFNPMPDYMMAEIMQGQNVSGAKELLEHHLAIHKTSRLISLSKLTNYYKGDTLNTTASSDSLLNILQAENNPFADYQLALLYLNKADSSNAYNTLDNIPFEFDLSQHEQDLHDLYSELFDVLWYISSDTLPIDSLHIQTLFDISDHYRSLPGIYARNILSTRNLITFIEPIYLPDIQKSTSAWETSIGSSENEQFLYVFPHYKIPQKNISPSITLSNTSGKIIYASELNDSENQIVIEIDDYPSGLYVVHLYNNSQLIESAKVVISK